MIAMVLNVVRWLGKSSVPQSHVHQYLRLFSDSTLLNPDCPHESCSRQFIREIREASGIEPATRTLVRSYASGHTVQVLLLKNIAQPHAHAIRN